MPSSGIQVYLGGVFDPLDPDPELVQLEEIAHSLATSTRYTGHAVKPYFIAEHVVRASRLVEKEHGAGIAMWVLHHDDPEAYIGDLASPLKRDPAFGQRFRGAEDRIMRYAICPAFNLPWPEPPEVHAVDTLMLKWEVRDIMPKPTPEARALWEPWLVDLPPAPRERIEPWGWRQAKARYLAQHAKLERQLRKEENDG